MFTQISRGWESHLHVLQGTARPKLVVTTLVGLARVQKRYVVDVRRFVNRALFRTIHQLFPYCTISARFINQLVSTYVAVRGHTKAYAAHANLVFRCL